jgi:hypothetical protein
MLREWREDFAAMMREQGVAANATSRAVRGRNKKKAQDRLYRARRHGAPGCFESMSMPLREN